MKSCTCTGETPLCANWVDAVLAGQQSVLAEIIAKFTPLVRHVARRILGSSQIVDVDDLVQEVFLHLCKVDANGVSKLSSWSRKGPFCNWLGFVAGNCCNSVLRGLKNSSQDKEDAFDPVDLQTAEPLDTLVKLERADRIAKIVATFPPDEQIVFWNYHVNELSYDDLSRLLGINEKSARRWMKKIEQAIEQSLLLDPISTD